MSYDIHEEQDQKDAKRIAPGGATAVVGGPAALPRKAHRPILYINTGVAALMAQIGMGSTPIRPLRIMREVPTVRDPIGMKRIPSIRDLILKSDDLEMIQSRLAFARYHASNRTVRLCEKAAAKRRQELARRQTAG